MESRKIKKYYCRILSCANNFGTSDKSVKMFKYDCNILFQIQILLLQNNSNNK